MDNINDVLLLGSNAPLSAPLIPVEFFQVKKGKPRGNFFCMAFFAIASLIVTGGTFVYLALEGSKATTTVSEVKTLDLTGLDGWEKCTMISKANDAYALGANSSYSLVNVMMSKTECAAALATADPCATLKYEADNSDPSNLLWQNAQGGYAIAMDSLGNLWAAGEGALSFFTPSSGKSTVVHTLRYSVDSGKMAIDSFGTVFYLNFIDGEKHTLDVYKPSTDTEETIKLNTTLGYTRSLAVDASGVVWVTSYASNDKYEWALTKYDPNTGIETRMYYEERYLESSSVGISVAPSGDIWGVGRFSNCTWDTASNFCSSGSEVYSHWMFKFDVTTEKFSVVLDLSLYWTGGGSTSAALLSSWKGGFVVDSEGVAWFLSNEDTFLKYDTASGVLTKIDLGLSDTSYCSGLVSDSSGNLYFTSNIDTETTTNNYIYKYSTSTGTLSLLQTYKGGNVVSFVCGDETQSTVPSTSEGLLSACSLNGVKLSASVEESHNCFSESEMGTWALSTSTAPGQCTSAVYDEVCATVAELPPYICTKEVADDVTVYLGVAAANAELLYAALVFLCGLMLDFIGRKTPKAHKEGEGEALAEAGLARRIQSKEGTPFEGVSKADLAALENKFSKTIEALERKVSNLEEQLAANGSKF